MSRARRSCPAKVNPTQCEALTMIAVQVMANDVAVGFGGAGGYLEMNVYKPLIIFNITDSVTLMTDGCTNFRKFLVEGTKPNLKKIKEYVERSLMLVTALAPVIGYDKASKIAHYAMDNDLTLKAAALQLGFVTEAEFDRVVDPKKMVKAVCCNRCLNAGPLARKPLPDPQTPSDLILAFARVLHVNGESTDETLAAIEPLARRLGLRARVVPSWEGLQLRAGRRWWRSPCPSGLNPSAWTGPRRLGSAGDRGGRRRAASAFCAMEAIDAISRAPPAPTWLFTLAAAAGAARCPDLRGRPHTGSRADRRQRRTRRCPPANPCAVHHELLAATLCAALIASIIGAFAVRYDLELVTRSSPLSVYDPGSRPHVLNGMLAIKAAQSGCSKEFVV